MIQLYRPLVMVGAHKVIPTPYTQVCAIDYRFTPAPYSIEYQNNTYRVFVNDEDETSEKVYVDVNGSGDRHHMIPLSAVEGPPRMRRVRAVYDDKGNSLRFQRVHHPVREGHEPVGAIIEYENKQYLVYRVYSYGVFSAYRHVGINCVDAGDRIPLYVEYHDVAPAMVWGDTLLQSAKIEYAPSLCTSKVAGALPVRVTYEGMSMELGMREDYTLGWVHPDVILGDVTVNWHTGVYSQPFYDSRTLSPEPKTIEPSWDWLLGGPMVRR